MAMQSFPRAGGLTYDASGVPINPAKEDGNLATLTGRVDVTTSGGQARTKLVDAAGNVINPAKEDGHLAAIDTATARLDTLLSTRATAAAQIDGTQRSGLLDGSGNAITSTVDGAKRRLDTRLQAEAADGAAAPGTAVLVGGKRAGNIVAPSVVVLGGREMLAATCASREMIATYEGRMFSAFHQGTYGTTETGVILLRNPAGSGRLAFVWGLNLDVIGNISQEAFYRVYHNCAVTANGTAITVGNMRAGAAAGVVAAYYGATATGGNTVLTRTATTVSTATQLIAFKHSLLLPPGTNLRITVSADGSGRACAACAIWEEVNE